MLALLFSPSMGAVLLSSRMPSACRSVTGTTLHAQSRVPVTMQDCCCSVLVGAAGAPFQARAAGCRSAAPRSTRYQLGHRLRRAPRPGPSRLAPHLVVCHHGRVSNVPAGHSQPLGHSGGQAVLGAVALGARSAVSGCSRAGTMLGRRCLPPKSTHNVKGWLLGHPRCGWGEGSSGHVDGNARSLRGRRPPSH